MKEHKTASLRMMLDALGNRYYLLKLIPSFIKKTLEKVLKEQPLSAEVRKLLDKAMDDLQSLETSAKEADQLLQKLKPTMYENLNPDEIQIETEGIEKILFKEVL